jgi:hypothetical protein
MGISKLTCTFKGDVPPKWPLDEYAPIAINKHGRMCEKLSTISSLCHARDFSRNRLIGSSTPLFFFSTTIEGFLGVRE